MTGPDSLRHDSNFYRLENGYTENEEEIVDSGNFREKFLDPQYFVPYLYYHPDWSDLPVVFEQVVCHSILKYAHRHPDEVYVTGTGSIGRGAATGEMTPGHWKISEDVQYNQLPLYAPYAQETDFLKDFTFDKAADLDTMITSSLPSPFSDLSNSIPELFEPVAQEITIELYETPERYKNFTVHSTRFYEMREYPDYVVLVEHGTVNAAKLDILKISIYHRDSTFPDVNISEFPPDRIRLNNTIYQRLMHIDSNITRDSVRDAQADNRGGTKYQNKGRVSLSMGGTENNPFIYFELSKDAQSALASQDELYISGLNPNQVAEREIRTIRINARHHKQTFGPHELPNWFPQENFFQLRRRHQEFVLEGFYGQDISISPQLAKWILTDLYVSHQLSLETIQILIDSGFLDAFAPMIDRSRELWEPAIRSHYFREVKLGIIQRMKEDDYLLTVRNRYRSINPDGLARSIYALQDHSIIDQTTYPVSGFLKLYSHLRIGDENSGNGPPEPIRLPEKGTHFFHTISPLRQDAEQNILRVARNGKSISHPEVLRFLLSPDNSYALGVTYSILTLLQSGLTARELKYWYDRWYEIAPVEYNKMLERLQENDQMHEFRLPDKEFSHKPEFNEVLTVLKLLGFLQITSRLTRNKSNTAERRIFYSLRSSQERHPLTNLLYDERFSSQFMVEAIGPDSEFKEFYNLGKTGIRKALSELRSAGIELLETLEVMRPSSLPAQHGEDYRDLARITNVMGDSTLTNIENLAEFVRIAYIKSRE